MDNSDHYTIGIDLQSERLTEPYEVDALYEDVFNALIARFDGMNITRQHIYTPTHGMGIRIKCTDNNLSALNQAVKRFNFHVNPSVFKSGKYIYYEIQKNSTS